MCSKRPSVRYVSSILQAQKPKIVLDLSGVGQNSTGFVQLSTHRPKAGRATRALTRGGSRSHEGHITVREEHTPSEGQYGILREIEGF